MKIKCLLNYGFTLLTVFCATTFLQAQCETWVDQPNQEDAENAHSIYRQALKSEDWPLALEYWEQAYTMAPAADGKRDYHYTDGMKIYLNKFANETDAAKKEEYKAKIDELYNAVKACYDAKSITLKCGDSDECYQKRIGYIEGRYASDMFYKLNMPYTTNLAMIDASFAKSGNDTEYIVFDPLARMVVYQFQNGKMDKQTALDYYKQMEEVAEFNFVNNEDLGEYYQQAWQAAKSQYRAIEKEIFDCEYFKPLLQEEYQDDPNNPDVIKSVLVRLKRRGCAEDDPFVMEIDKEWKKYAAEANAKAKAEFEANNPGSVAKKLYDEGDFEGAVAKYQEAINAESDPNKKANYLNGLASIKFRKLSQYGEARRLAKQAAELKPNWGRPYMLIGDMYAKSARNCGDAWNQRLAIIAAMDKYNYAKSIDASVAEEANKRVARYRTSLPPKDEGFMRGVKAGDAVKVGCWIGETVKIKFSN